MTDKSQKLALALIKEAKENGTLDKSIKAELTELMGTEARPKLREVIKSFFAREPADITELVKKPELETQYGERLDTLKHYGFLTESGEVKEGDVACPFFEKAMSTFKPEELEIASHFQKPTLLLIPETSFAAKVKALDAQKKNYSNTFQLLRAKVMTLLLSLKINRQGMQKNDTYVNEIYTDSDSGSDKIIGWCAVIVDGAQEMEAYEGDKLDSGFDERIRNRKETRKSGEKGMDRHRYALLMMEAIRNGNPVDKESYTLLDDDPALSPSDVPGANFNPNSRRVRFSRFRSGNVSGGAQFRSSVGGDALIS